MGLITCTKCGKIYDYNKYSGICPKCARYNSESTSAEEHRELHDQYDGGYRHNEQDEHHSFHQKYDDEKNPHTEQLKGVQMTMDEVMNARPRVVTEQNMQEKKKMDKRSKIVLGIIIFVFAINFILPFIFSIVSFAWFDVF